MRATFLDKKFDYDSQVLWAGQMGLIKHPYRVMRYGVTEEKELDARPVIGWTWDFPVYERETNDDALAAALGGVPQTQALDNATVPKFHKWERVPPSIAVALFVGPLALLGEPGRESYHGVPLPSHPYLTPADPVPSDGDDRVPIIPNMPGRGPWPRGGRPPHGQRLRLERIGEPSTATSMSGSWFGTRLSISGNVSSRDPYRFSVDSVFRATLTVTPEGKVTGWIKDTVGNLTLGGKVHVDSEEQEVVLDRTHRLQWSPWRDVRLFAAREGAAEAIRVCGAALLAGDWTQFSGGARPEGILHVAQRRGQGQQERDEEDERRCGLAPRQGDFSS